MSTDRPAPWEEEPTDVVNTSGPRSGRDGRQLSVMATILCHPVPSRIGQRALLGPITRGKAELSRSVPEFAEPGALQGEPLMVRWVSRRPVHVQWTGERTRVWAAPTTAVQVATQSVALGPPDPAGLSISDADLATGVVIVLGSTVVLLLHSSSVDPEQPTRDSSIVGASEAIVTMKSAIARVGPMRLSVLITGESGSGKELVARALHDSELPDSELPDSSPRRERPFVAVNMATLSPGTAASALFGHTRGAFTGATARRRGLFELADGGTLFMDEVGGARPEVQKLLLRVLETSEIRPVGSDSAHAVTVRVVSATDAELDGTAGENHFEPALLHRLGGYRLRVPPLRARRDDIGRLLLAFIRQACAEAGAAPPESRGDGQAWLDPQLVARLALHEWPGNVRQLLNVARRLVVAAAPDAQFFADAELEEMLRPADDKTPAATRVPSATGLSDLTDSALLGVLKSHGYSVGATAAALAVSRTALYARMASAPDLPLASQLEEDVIRRALEAAAGDVTRAAQTLRVSRRSLVRRLTALNG